MQFHNFVLCLLLYLVHKKVARLCKLQTSLFVFFSVGVHVLVEDVNEFAPKWKLHADQDQEPLHTLTSNVAVEEGQLLEEVVACFLCFQLLKNGLGTWSIDAFSAIAQLS